MNTAPDFSKLKMSMDFEPLLDINENGDSTLHVAVRLRNVELVWKTLNEPGIDVNHLNFNRKTPLHLACAIGHVSIIWLLVAFGADVFKRDRKNVCAYDLEIVQMIVSSDVWQRSLTSIHGDSSLHDAIKYGDWPWEEVKTLIEQQEVLVNSTNSYNETPLHLACACGYIDIVKLLMSNGADMYKRDCYNNTAFHRAIIKGHVDVVDYFITNHLYHTREKGYQGRSPLHLACCLGNTTLVNDLVLKCHFSEIAVGDASTLTPLHLAVLYNQIAVAEQLITKHGHSVDCVNENKETPLHFACFSGRLPFISMFVHEHQAGLDVCNKDKDRPLNKAVLGGHSNIVRKLISGFGCSPYIKGFEGRSLLHQACIKGNIELSTMLITDLNLDPSSTDDSGNTPLHLACWGGHKELARLLISTYYCAVDIVNKNNETPLHTSCSLGYLDIVKMLILEHKADINACNKQNDTPTNIAALNGQNEIVKLLKNGFGCSLQVKEFKGSSLLHRACYKGNAKLAVMLIADFELDPSSADDSGNTPLHMACWGGHKDLARLLISKYNCSTKIKNKKHQMPLHGACLFGHIGIVRMLVSECKADVNARDHKNNTPVCNAVFGGYIDIAEMLITMFHHSLQVRGFEFSRSLLHHACENGSTKLSVILITEFGLNPSSADDNGNTPLHMACWGGHEDLARLLITKYNCFVDVINNNKETPLHIACSCGHLSVVRMLVSENAVIYRHNYEKNTPISIAILGEHTEIVQFFISIPECKTLFKEFEGQSKLLLQACYTGNTELLDMLTKKFNLVPSESDDGSGNTALHIACCSGHKELVRLLITKYECLVSIQNNEGSSPLHFTCLYGHFHIAEMLITEYKAENVCDYQGDTPLHKAAEGGHTHLLQMLIEGFEIDPEIAGFQGRTPLHTACSKDHDSTARLLISSFQLSLLKTDNYGNTPLHISAMYGQSKCVHMLLYDFHAPVLLRNKSGNTALEVSRDSNISNTIKHYLKQERNELQSEYKELQNISTRKYSGAQKLSRVFVVGNIESGKSTLIESLKRESFFSSFSEVSEAIVPPHTCGIVPSVHYSKAWGRVLYYDFAGDPEYYSSHSAILSSVMHSRLGTNLFLLVVNLTKEYNCICEELGYWFSFIANHTNSELINTCKVLIVGSHADVITHSDANIKISKLTKEYSTHPIIQVVNTVALNCRRPRSSRLLRRIISQILWFAPTYSLSLNGAILLGLLLKDFKNVITCKLEKVLSHIAETGICLPKTVEPLYLVLHELHTLGLLMIIERNNRVECNSPDITLLLNIPKLTNEVHELLFSDHPASYNVTPQLLTAPYSASMGILPVNYLDDILPDYITVECLVQLQYCQEFNHAVVNSDYSVAPTEACNIPKLLYFPALCKIERKKNIVTPPNYKYKIGWFAKCCGKFDYFPPRFLHVLLLQLAFKFAQPVAPCELSERSKVEIEMLKSNCRCTMWKNGIHWHMEEGVECIVELVSNNRGLVVITKSDEVHVSKCKCTDMLFKIIDMAMQAKAEHCHSISLKQYLMLLNCDDISSFSNQDKLFDMNDVDRVLKEGKDSVLSITGKWPVKTTTLAHLRKFTFWGKTTTHELVTFA